MIKLLKRDEADYSIQKYQCEEMKILRHCNEHGGGSIQRDCRFYFKCGSWQMVRSW